MGASKRLFENFNSYINHKSENEYILNFDNKSIATETFITSGDEDFIIEDNKITFSTEYVNKLSPDNIDSGEFWKIATDNFPLFSISGGVQTITTTEEANNMNLIGAYRLQALDPILDMFRKNDNPYWLEIGPGWGGLEELMSKSFENKNYYGIDVHPLVKHPNVYKCDGKNIPSEIPNGMDMVYSVNVFQHLSKAQRTSYYKQIHIILKEGGKFIFGMFVFTERNKDLPVWGYRDETGRLYTSFFKQLTPIDTEEEILTELIDIGFNVKQISPISNTHSYIVYECTKPTKK